MLNSPSGEFGGCSWRLLRGGPAHQRVLPALPGVKVHLPLLGVVDARLHGRLGRHEDVNLPCFDVFLGDPGQGGDVLGGGAERRTAQRTVSEQPLGLFSQSRIRTGNNHPNPGTKSRKSQVLLY